MSTLRPVFDRSGANVAYIVPTLGTETLKVQPVAKEAAHDDQSAVVVYQIAKSRPKTGSIQWVSEDTLALTFVGSNECDLFNVQTAEVVTTLKASRIIQCLTVSRIHYGRVYVVDSEGSLVQYQMEADLSGWTLQQTYKLGAEFKATTQMLDLNQDFLLLFSNSVALFDKAKSSVIDTKSLYVGLVNSVARVSGGVIVSAENDRFINTLRVSEGRLETAKEILVTETPVVAVEHFQMEEFGVETVAAVTEAGQVEVFNGPYSGEEEEGNVEDSPSKKRRKHKGPVVTSKRCDAKIELTRKLASSSESLKADDIHMDAQHLRIGWLESSSYFAFETKDWYERSDKGVYKYTLSGQITVEKALPIVSITQSTDARGSDLATARPYVESEALVSSGANLGDVKSEDEGKGADGERDDFGHLVEKLNISSPGQPSIKTRKRKLGEQSSAVVLAQALRSNDKILFDSVISANESEEMVKNTVSRLDSGYVLKLLEILSERLSRGKGSKSKAVERRLDMWVRCVLVYHGSYLMNLPDLDAQLSMLSTGFRMRTQNLSRLLELRSKIGMLTDRIAMRQELQQLEEKNEKLARAEVDVDVDVEYVEELDDAGMMDGTDEEGEGGDSDDDE